MVRFSCLSLKVKGAYTESRKVLLEDRSTAMCTKNIRKEMPMPSSQLQGMCLIYSQNNTADTLSFHHNYTSYHIHLADLDPVALDTVLVAARLKDKRSTNLSVIGQLYTHANICLLLHTLPTSPCNINQSGRQIHVFQDN